MVSTRSMSLSRFLGRFDGRRIAVAGDFMLDQFIWGCASRLSAEAPVPIVETQSETFEPGGAGNVAANLAALGAIALPFGIIGKDLAESNPDLYGHLADNLGEVPTICLNKKFPLWDRYCRDIVNKNAAVIEEREEEYMVALSVVIAELWVAEDQRKKAETAETNPEDKAMNDKQRRRAITFAARGVVAMMPQIDKIFAQIS